MDNVSVSEIHNGERLARALANEDCVNDWNEYDKRQGMLFPMRPASGVDA